ncbi:MAG: hypothetical protein MUC50_11340 [Myxococcota bacterium]|jgi:hypothetical protein|nr:hypothetical protein [Myxococcota bacterium]
MRQARWNVICLVALAAALTVSSGTRAGKLDLSLARFIECDATGLCEPQIAEYERFLAEYTFGLAPKLLSGADTLGYSGFYLGLEGTLTPRPGSAGSADRWSKGTAPLNAYPDVMFVPSVHLRKGLPWSFELGGTINYLAQSELVGIGMDIKWSLLEGYQHGFRGYLPSAAVRASVVRVLGESDIDLTILGIDGSISYEFGIQGAVILCPYLGYQHLFAFARTEPMVHRDDKTDPQNPTYKLPEGEKYNMTGLSGPNLTRSRLFVGTRFEYEILALALEVAWGLAKSWDTAVEKQAPQGAPWTMDPEQFHSDVANQVNVSMAVGMVF